MKKVGKTTRPSWYDLNQIPYDYTVEVSNRLKGPDVIDREPDELWKEVRDIVQETLYIMRNARMDDAQAGRLLGEISINSNIQTILSLRQAAKRN